MTPLDDLVTRIARKARAESSTLAAPVGDEDLRHAEEALGFALPPLLAAIYRRVGNGGFGPGNAVKIPGYNAAVLYPLERAVRAYRSNRTTNPELQELQLTPWPEGVLEFLYWGCFGYSAVDCRSPAGTVLHFEEDVAEVRPDEAWKVEAASLATWWEAWLSETQPEAGEVWTGWRSRT